MKVILPKSYVGLPSITAPFFFLAGPNKGGGSWHADCCNLLSHHLSDFIVAVPRPYKEGYLHEHRIVSEDDTKFSKQLNWERHYLDMAALEASICGCIIFWHPAEDILAPRKDGKPYAMDTRGETGEWRGAVRWCPHKVRVVMGGEHNYPGIDTVCRNNNLATNGRLVTYTTLHETVLQAVIMAGCTPRA